MAVSLPAEVESAILSAEEGVADLICAYALARMMDLAEPKVAYHLERANEAISRARVVRRGL